MKLDERNIRREDPATESLGRGVLVEERLDPTRARRWLVRGIIRPYGTAALIVAAAFVATMLIRGFFPYPFLFLFFAAVMASAWFGGTGPGLFAVLLSTLVVDYFFVPPYDSFAVNTTDGTFFVAFIFCALVASSVSASKKRSEEALREARDEMGLRVSERTAELQASNAQLRHTQAEVAHLSRVLTMGELTTSIAHEINQPLTAVVAHGHACVEWLSAAPPNLYEAKRSAEKIIQDGTRAGAVIGRIRSLFKKEAPAKHPLDMNEVIQELTVFLRDELVSNKVVLRTELAPDLPEVIGDRVQLQQVVLNLVVNAIDALRGKETGAREIVIWSNRDGDADVLITVEDTGAGFTGDVAEKIFHPFFTTKMQGIGMGLSISRSIVESHGGRLWATPRAAGGAVFQFSLRSGVPDPMVSGS